MKNIRYNLVMNHFLNLGSTVQGGVGPKMAIFLPIMTKHGELFNVAKWSKTAQKVQLHLFGPFQAKFNFLPQKPLLCRRHQEFPTEYAEQDLKLMTGKLKLAEVEAVELSKKLKEKEIPKN